MTAPRPRDAAVVAAFVQRLGAADATTLANLAWFAARRGATAAALDVVRRAVAMPGAPRAAWRTLERLAVGRTDQLLLTLPMGDAALPAGHTATHPLAAAVAAHAQGALAVAEACYWAATGESADAAAAWNGLAVLHEARGERIAADDAWSHVGVSPTMVVVHNRTLAWHRRGETRHARELLTAALARFAPSAPVLALAGYLAYLDGEAAVSVPLLTAAITIDARLARAHFTLGLAHERLGAHTLAVEATRHGLQCSPWFVPEVWLLENGRREGTVEVSVEPSTEATAATDDVLLALGRSLLETMHFGEALTAFDQVLVRHPAHTAALFHRGVVLAKLRRYADALADWEKVGRVDGESTLGAMSRRHARSASELAALFGVS